MKFVFKKSIESWLKKQVPNIEDLYWLPVPFAMQRKEHDLKQEVIDTYDDLCSMIDNDDTVFKLMSSLGFRVCEEQYDFRAAVARGKICPDATDKETVELDANIWITEQLAPIQNIFIAYELAGKIEVIPQYDAARDVVVFFMRPTLIADMEYFNELLPTAKFLTKMFCFTAGIILLLLISTILAIIVK